MATFSDDQFIKALIKQLDVKSIDFKRIAVDIGGVTENAARCRWYRFKGHITGKSSAKGTSTSAKRSPNKAISEKISASKPKEGKAANGKRKRESDDLSEGDHYVVKLEAGSVKRELPKRIGRIIDFKALLQGDGEGDDKKKGQRRENRW